MAMTRVQNNLFQNATLGHICQKRIHTDDRIVCAIVTLIENIEDQLKTSTISNIAVFHMIPVVFHDLSGYDAHFMIKNLATQIPGVVYLLPINK